MLNFEQSSKVINKRVFKIALFSEYSEYRWVHKTIKYSKLNWEAQNYLLDCIAHNYILCCIVDYWISLDQNKELIVSLIGVKLQQIKRKLQEAEIKIIKIRSKSKNS